MKKPRAAMGPADQADEADFLKKKFEVFPKKIL